MGNSIAKQFFEQWKAMVEWVNENLELLTDEELQAELSPGKNHGVWLLGHIIESEDNLSVYLGKAPRLYPEYEAIFGQRSKLLPVGEYPLVALLRSQWVGVVAKNETILSQMPDAEWNEPHAKLQPGEEETDYFATKGRCIMIWILHQNYHNGQLSLLVSKSGKARY